MKLDNALLGKAQSRLTRTFAAALAFVALTAQAATTGKATLYVNDDFGNESNFIEVTETDGAKVTGRSTFAGNDTTVRLTKENGIWAGRANAEFWSLGYANGRAGGGSSQIDIAFERDGSFAGTINVGVPQTLRGTLTPEKIEVIAPFGGVITLNKTREGRYSARGQLADRRTTFSGDLKVEGSFAQMDPALLVILFGGALIQR